MNTHSLRIPIVVFLALAGLTPQAFADCKCRPPEKGDETRWGGNQAIVLVPEVHVRELKGTVLDNELVKGALAEVFDNPEYLVSNKPWNERPRQNRLRACVTSADGKFCFKDLPSGTYELRIGRDNGWDVTHVYVVVDRKSGTSKPIRISMHIGT